MRVRRAIAFAAIAVACVFVWRWMPHDRPGPTPEMSSAMANLLGEACVADRAPEPAAEPASARERLMSAAWDLRGVPYRYGAKGPSELDCSGFTKEAYAAIGVALPDGSFNQARGERPLASLNELRSGDLLFYRWAGAKGVSHVTIYAGDGWVIGTGSPGQRKEVVLYPITDDLVGDGRIITYRHIPLADEG